jgi:hypothetical protein
MAVSADTPFGLVEYYSNLLVKQYITKAAAVATIETTVAPIIMPQQSVQTITFPLIPTSGSFTLTYDDSGSYITIDWNESTLDIQTAIRSLPPGAITGGSAINTFQNNIIGGNAGSTLFQNILNGGDAYGFNLNQVLVSGTIAGGVLTVTFVGVVPPAAMLEIGTSSLMSSGTPVLPIIAETDLTMPLAVQNGYQILGSDLAVGVQLDVIGKYCGVTRTGAGFTTQITLDDSDFVQLIKMAIARNNSGSSLSDIQQEIATFFPDGQLLVFDYANMHMSYMISESVGSFDLVELFVTEGLLPKPMGVQLGVIYAPVIDTFFGMRTYFVPAYNVSPFNTYASYASGTPWLSYVDAVIPQ